MKVEFGAQTVIRSFSLSRQENGSALLGVEFLLPVADGVFKPFAAAIALSEEQLTAMASVIAQCVEERKKEI